VSTDRKVFMASPLGRTCIACALVVACSLAVGLTAQTPPEKVVPKVKTVPTPPIVSIEGKDNFDAYCAVCHGSDGKGHGPAAPAMKVAVPDLTTIAQRNKGKFNPVAVEYIIMGTGKTSTPAHGVETMPIWGEVFRSEDRGRVTLRITNLVTYVQSLQVDPGKAPR
jgi:mono/diheme cytochrome c family protein